MKKLLALILAAALALSLAACGGSGAGNTPNTGAPNGGDNTTPDAATQLDAESAIAETPKHIYKDVMENQARAMQNTYLMNCRVGTIAGEYFTTDYGLQIYLPAEQLAQLNKGDIVAIIGKITDVYDETAPYGSIETMIIFGMAELYDGVVPDVAPREDEIFVGLLSGPRSGTWNIYIVGSASSRPIHFADGEDISTLSDGDAITFSADTMGFEDNPESYTNAKIIEIRRLAEVGPEGIDRYLAGME